MTDTAYAVVKRPSPDGKLTQYGIYEGSFFIALAEFPAASLEARLKQWNEINPPPTPEPPNGAPGSADGTTTPPSG